MRTRTRRKVRPLSVPVCHLDQILTAGEQIIGTVLGENTPEEHVVSHDRRESARADSATIRGYRQQTAEFPDGERVPSTCETCGCAIPPTRAKCTDHRESDSGPRSETEFEWTISRVAIAVVPGATDKEAIAKGAIAVRFRPEANKTDESYAVIDDFDDPSQTLTKNWGGELPSAVTIQSDTGQQLLSHAKDHANWEETRDSKTQDDASETKPFIYDEQGDPVTQDSQLTALKEAQLDDRVELWVVPAVLYERRQETTNSTLQFRECMTCESSTQHIFAGFENGHPSLHSDGVAIWICRECSIETEGAAPATETASEPWNSDDYTGGDRYDVDTALAKKAEEEFQCAMERLNQEGRLRNR